MAKIKITESQLKMIAKHKALNESFGEPESNSKSADFWNWRESNQDDELRTSIFEKIERMYDAGKIGEQDAYELMATYDNEEFGAEEDLTDLDTPRRVFNKLKKHNSLNESFDEPEEDTYKHKNGLFNWRDDEDEDDYVRTEVFEEIERLVRKGKIDEDDAYALMYEYDANGGGSEAYDYDTDQDNTPISNFDTNELLQNLMQRATPHLLNNKDMEDDEPIDYTMGSDDENQLPNPPSEINLNEGQLLLKKVFNQFK
jgi:hypothetical protein